MAGWDDDSVDRRKRREPNFGTANGDGYLEIGPDDRPVPKRGARARENGREDGRESGRDVGYSAPDLDYASPPPPPRRRREHRPEDVAPEAGPAREARMSRRREPDDAYYDDDPPSPPPRRDRTRAEHQRREKPRRRRSLIGRMTYWSLVACVWAIVGFAGFLGYNAMKLPPIDQLAVPKRPPNIAILAADGALMANRGETGGSNINIKELPRYVAKAFVAIEDRRFYDHFGVDVFGLVRAAMRNVSSGKVEQGGSTLTQQLAKNLFLTQERTMSRKAQEVILALWLERNYTKDQILELYLNRVYFGAGAYGIEAAAQKYFGKSARTLTLGESVILAGLMKSPSRLAPNRNPEGAAERAALVLKEMQDQGYVTPKEAKAAMASPAEARRQTGAGSANYAADWVMDMIDDFVGRIDGDIQVTTTFQMPVQNAAEQALTSVLEKNGDAKNVDQGALVAMAPDGAVRALVGGRNYAESQFNRAVLARRQPGSAFKPFVYLTAIEHGLTPETVREDSAINIKGWQPENYTREYFGNVTLTRALSMSLNTVAVKLGQEVGIRNVARTAQRLGINAPLSSNASLALGTSEVTPLEMTAAYAPFANGGMAVTPYVITRVRTVAGKVIYERKAPERARVIEPQALAAMNLMMRETLVSGTARKADVPGWVAAGKTGTTQEHKDAWFIGYTGALVATVWLGNDDGDPMKKVSGSGLPVEVWTRFMRSALAGVPPRPLPSLVHLSPLTRDPLPAAGPQSQPQAPRPVTGDSPAASTGTGDGNLIVRPPLPLTPPSPPRTRARAPVAEAPEPAATPQKAAFEQPRRAAEPARQRPESLRRAERRPETARKAEPARGERQTVTEQLRLVPPKSVGVTGSVTPRAERRREGPSAAERARLSQIMGR